jgi:hypothetical protein
MSTTKPELTFAEKVEMFRATATNQQARADFAASRADVILPLLDEQSTIRFIYNVEKLAPGAEARWDIPFEDIECTWTMPNIGGIPTVQVEGAEIRVDTFGLDAGIEYQQDIAKDGRFQVATLATNLLKNKFIRQEEMAGWSLIRTHAAVIPAAQKLQAWTSAATPVQTPGSGKLNVYTLNSMLTIADNLGIGGRRVTDIYVSPTRFGDLRDQLTMAALPEIYRAALYGDGTNPAAPTAGSLRVHKVYNHNLVADNKGYAFTQKDGYFYGVMPIREELSTRDNPIACLEWKIGTIGRERVGFGVIDDKGLIEITF